MRKERGSQDSNFNWGNYITPGTRIAFTPHYCYIYITYTALLIISYIHTGVGTLNIAIHFSLLEYFMLEAASKFLVWDGSSELPD